VKKITNFFLRAKHWQLFVLMWGTYFLGQVTIRSSFSITTAPLEYPLKFGLFIAAVMLPFVLCFMAWLWSLGSFLFVIVGDRDKLNFRLFRFGIIFPTLYLLIVSPFLFSPNLFVRTVIFPTHFLMTFFLIYAFYFVSKSLVIAEKGPAITFHDYLPSLFLLFVSIIGVWFIQPRINRLYARTVV